MSDADEAQTDTLKQRKQQRKRPRKTKTTTFPTLEELFGTQSDSWTRFHEITGTEELDNLEIYEELNKKLLDDFECFRRRDGSILIDAKTRRNAKEIQNLKEILNKNVTSTRDPQLNSVRGTILVPLNEFKNTDSMEERILNHLLLQDIPASKVTIFRKTSRRKTTLVCACITFESRTIPPTVRIGFEKVKVKEDIPKPRQCRKCWKFGHPAQYCNSTPCCPICGVPNHPMESCPHEGNQSFKGHCPNCNNDGHTAFSKKCDLYRKEAEILSTMYRQGIPKNRARRLIEEAGMFANVSYARRAAQPETSGTRTKQQQQQPSYRNQQPHQGQHNEQSHNTTSENTSNRAQPEETQAPPEEEQEAQQETVEDQMSALFSGDSEPFLSVELESTEQQSTEEVLSQVFQRKVPETGQKRKTEEAFPQSPTEEMHESRNQTSRRRCDPPTNNSNKKEEGLTRNHSQERPLSTSSPSRIKPMREKSQEEREIDPASLLSKVCIIDKSTGAISKGTTIPKTGKSSMQDDGQHNNANNCGCHTCITNLSIVKRETLNPNQRISKKFREQINKLKIYKNTPMRSHPTPCVCKTHLEKYPLQPVGIIESLHRKVSSLRTQFETGDNQKIDPRTGLPPPRPSNSSETQPTKKGNKQNISVITSR